MDNRLKAPVTVALLALVACQTNFTGDAQFPSGPGGCWQKCRSVQLDMGAYVYAGEYSSACVCVPPNAPRVAAAGGVTAAAVGVMTQMRRQQEQAQAQRR